VTVDAQLVLEAARAEGFELAGLTPAAPQADFARYEHWVAAGMAAGMGYLQDHRADVRRDPRAILPSARTMLCVGMLYNGEGLRSHEELGEGRGWIARYAWGSRDYHDVLREALERVVARLRTSLGEFEARVCVDTAPLLERSFAREAGLGWIGKNTCLIREGAGSWFFLGEVLFSFEASAYGTPPPDRCGSCTRCIEACPTAALVPEGERWALDSARCISYWTIEAKEAAPEELKKQFGAHLFGCDICQDVCPWNRKAPVTDRAEFQMLEPGAELRAWTEEEFRERFRQTPVWRSKLEGWRRNVEVARANLEDRRKQSG
jgi:epoxyqueuosine reductase